MRKFFKASLATIVAIAVIFGLSGPIAVQAAGPLPVNLGTAANFAILAGTPNITNVATSVITGNVGLSPGPGSGIGLTQAQVTGTMYAVDATGPAGTENNPTVVNQAKLDLTAAYTDAAGRTPVIIVPTELGGQHLYPGVYATSSTALQISAPTPLILDAQGDASAVFIFEASSEVAGALTVGPGSTVSLINGASACNVFWRVYGATIDTTAVFKGNIMAYTSIAVANGANIEGRLLAQTGNVALIADTVSIPDCTASDTARAAAAAAAATAAAAAAAAAAAKLPATGVAPSHSSIPWNIVLIAGIFAVSTLFVITRRKKIT